MMSRSPGALAFVVAGGVLALLLLNGTFYRELRDRLGENERVFFGDPLYLELTYLHHRKAIGTRKLDLLAILDVAAYPVLAWLVFAVLGQIESHRVREAFPEDPGERQDVLKPTESELKAMIWHLAGASHPLALGLGLLLLHAALQVAVFRWLRRRATDVRPEHLFQPAILGLKYLALGRTERRLSLSLAIGTSLLSLFLGLFFVTVHFLLR